MKKAAIYIRVSTTEQLEHGFSVDEQRERLIAYCKAMGWDVAGLYVDGAFSGSNMDRPGLKKMMDEIKLFDVVVIYKLDRLSRSQKDTLHIIEDVLLKHNVGIVSLQEQLDTTTPFGRAAIGILSAFAQLERETFKERSKLGRTGRARTGKWVGTTRPPIGYDYIVEKQELKINPYEAEQVKEVFRLYIQGVGLQKIAEIMHEKGYRHKYGDWAWWGGVTTMLKNSVYIGKVTFDGKEYDGLHIPIIDVATFNKAQEMLKMRQSGQIYKRKSPFSHLMVCGNCHARMFFLHKKDSVTRKPRYVCYSRYGKPPYMVKDRECKLKNWETQIVDGIIMSEIELIATNKKHVQKLLKYHKPRKSNTEELKNKLEDIDKQINKLLELYKFEDIPADKLNSLIRGLQDEKNGINTIIQSINEEANKCDYTVQTIQDIAKELISTWNEIEIAKQIDLVNRLISQVVITDDNIDITWSFALSDGD